MSAWRNKFEGILKAYGYNVLLQRRTTDTGSGIYAVRENHGYSQTLERHTVRSRLAGRAASLPGLSDEMTEGLVQTVDQVFYFKWDVNPDKGDRIYESEPIGTEIFIVDWAQPYRGPGGQVIYWAAGASLEQRNDA